MFTYEWILMQIHELYEQCKIPDPIFIGVIATFLQEVNRRNEVYQLECLTGVPRNSATR